MELEEYEYNEKPRGEDDFELEDIDDDEDEGFIATYQKLLLIHDMNFQLKSIE